MSLKRSGQTVFFPNPRRRVRTHRKLAMENLELRQLLYGAIDTFSPLAGEGEDAAVPDFSLEDVNSTSATYQQAVSPRQYLQEVTGWYFGSAL